MVKVGICGCGFMGRTHYNIYAKNSNARIVALMDVNQDPGTDNYCDPDTDSGDRRYAYAQDRNWNIVALLETDDGVGTAGAAAERYAYTPYGLVQSHHPTNGAATQCSTISNPLMYQGLFRDSSEDDYSARWRLLPMSLHRFSSRDPLPTENYSFPKSRKRRSNNTFAR